MIIGEANTESSFITNKHGFDVCRIARFTKNDQLPPEHELLNDEQWQKLIDTIDEAIAKLDF